jgi:hypothetical protein
MYAEVIHPETGEKYTLDMPNLKPSDLDTMKKEYTTNETVRSYIEQLSVSAETKLLLMKIAEFSISVGNTVIKMGKKILEMVIMLASKYKHAAFGMLLGALLASLIAAVPFLGPPLAAFLQPLLMLIGLGKGLWEDLKKESPNIAVSIQDAGSVFYPLNTNAAF